MPFLQKPLALQGRPLADPGLALPAGQVFSLQKSPAHPSSHTHLLAVSHSPWPKHLLKHTLVAQSAPLHPSMHLQDPPGEG